MQGFKLDTKGWFGIADEEWINPDSTCLLIIGMQNYDASRDWALIGTAGTGTAAASSQYYYSRIEKVVVPAIQKVLAFFRDRKLTVIHAVFASRFDPYVENDEIQIIPALAPLPEEAVLTKVTGECLSLDLSQCNST
jgi:hypothetical protein